MPNLEIFLSKLKDEYTPNHANSVPVTVNWYMDEHCEIEGCNAYITVTTPNWRGGVDTLKCLYAYIQGDIVDYTCDPGYY